MASLEIKNAKGKVVGSHAVGSALSGAEPLAHLLHAAVVAEEANSRQGTQSAKTRSETRGGGRKPYKQKKTGNARQGTIRAPHYAHGGMALAVKPRDYAKKLNKKERRAALVGALKAQMDAGNVVLTEKISFSEPKTKTAVDLLTGLGVVEAKRILVIVGEHDETTLKCFRNIPNVVVRTAPSQDQGAKTVAFSTRDLLIAHKIVVGADAMGKIEAVYGGEEVAEKAEKPKAKKAEKPAAKAKAPAANKEAKTAAPKKTTRTKKADAPEESGS